MVRSIKRCGGDDMKRWRNRPQGSNWGDFGDDDQRGRMNLLTPARRLAAVREVREGVAFTLGLPLDLPGGGVRGTAQRDPPRLFAKGVYAQPLNALVDAPQVREVLYDDGVVLFTQYSTQWDAFCHMSYAFDADGDGVAERLFYNGYRPGTDVIPADAPGGPYARALGIENLATAGVQGRGVLVDFFSIYGRAEARVGYDALMQAMAAQKVEVERGDFLCLYTGMGDLVMEMGKSPDAASLEKTCAGLDGRDARLLRWIDESGIVAICADNNAVEKPSIDAKGGPHAGYPIHELCLFKLGIHLGEFWYFTELAAWLKARGRNAFLLTAPPLRLPGAVGSPVTPIATV